MAPVGTIATMLVVVQLVADASVPLNLTVLGPWLLPKLEPAMVTDAPTAPDVGERFAMAGAGTTVNRTPLLAGPFFTTTLPVVAAVGTIATIVVAFQLVAVANTPLNFTVLDPWVFPKPLPIMVTEAPTAPELGDRLLITGFALARAGKKKEAHTTEKTRIRSDGLRVMDTALSRSGDTLPAKGTCQARK